jgi:ATP-binding cassette subfamily B protein RaxB
MDEATSHLDTQNVAIINEHIKELAVTRIIVAHRPETILSAERILKLENGCLTDVTKEFKAEKQ